MNLYREPNRHTCPDIDKALNNIWQTVKCYEKLNSEDETAKEAIDDILHEMTNIADTLEYLRKSNDELRCWGNDLVSRCQELEEETYQNENKINSLEDKIDELKNELQEL